MFGWNAIWAAGLAVLMVAMPVSAQDGDPGGGSELSGSNDRSGDFNDRDAEPADDRDFGDPGGSEGTGGGEEVDDRDEPGSEGLSGGSTSGGSDVGSDYDAPDSPALNNDENPDSDERFVFRNNGRGG